jgi:hypothetical protein
MKNTATIQSALALATLALISCGQGDKPATPSSQPAADLLSSFFVEAAPAAAIPISEAFADPTPGRAITVFGEVMGHDSPLVEGRAIAVLGDPTTLTPCNRNPGDDCPTPWDVCCDDPDTVRRSIATIQLVDPDGAPLRQGLRGVREITELSFLTVSGTLAEGSTADNLLIDVTAIHVAPESPFKDAPPVTPHPADL